AAGVGGKPRPRGGGRADPGALPPRGARSGALDHAPGPPWPPQVPGRPGAGALLRRAPARRSLLGAGPHQCGRPERIPHLARKLGVPPELLARTLVRLGLAPEPGDPASPP